MAVEMGSTMTVRVDAKGRFTVPQRIRRELGIEPGDTLFVDYDEETKVVHYAKAGNPFDILAEHALTERQAGRTRGLREFAAENDIAVDAGCALYGRAHA